ncbi:PGAP1-like alpha/beta domain-containing protein [Paenibacillus sedimenti]|uniref:Alpha/beta hydrolase n=1 Tax=Paenibacillus sedimenti TaxID=2770274 RepID=A0A926KMG1_9BACL|nr:alpha/beta hydrolase [Paenibacillus sedimenti]MBD0378725.1 alpha/beta hydrolase [Paenibacillus sedimenti]
MMKKFAASVFLAFMLVVSFVIAPATAAVSNPNLNRVPGTWSPGATPPNLDSKLPVILFVQGLGSNAGSWYDTNDMYQTAYNNGYQTAFIELNDSGGTPKNMWDNGQLLAQKIAVISQYFNKKLMIVAHSKGGVDTQAALVHYKAYPYVTNVITLSSPHRGSELADLAYSSWAGWLADLIGYKNDATYSMQTSYMSYFRSITDSNANSSYNKFYTFAGKGWAASPSSSYFAGGLYLSLFGNNDGVVTVNSSYVPKGTMIKVGEWDHNTIRKGSTTFSLFKPYLTATGTASTKADVQSELVTIASSKPSDAPQDITVGTASNLLVRGGAHNGTASESFLVENDVRSLTIDWISDQKADQVELISPTGKQTSIQVTSYQDEQVFKNAWHHIAVVNNPDQGAWTFQAQNAKPGGYLMAVHYDSDLDKSIRLKLNNEKTKAQIGWDKASLKGGKLNVQYQVDFTPEGNHAGGKKQTTKIKGLESIDENSEVNLTDENSPGVYQASFIVKGQTEKGIPFERTLIRSIYVDEKGERH